MAKQKVRRPERSTKRESCGNCGNVENSPFHSVTFRVSHISTVSTASTTSYLINNQNREAVSSIVYPALVAGRLRRSVRAEPEGLAIKMRNHRPRRTIFLTP